MAEPAPPKGYVTVVREPGPPHDWHAICSLTGCTASATTFKAAVEALGRKIDERRRYQARSAAVPGLSELDRQAADLERWIAREPLCVTAPPSAETRLFAADSAPTLSPGIQPRPAPTPAPITDYAPREAGDDR